MKPAIRRIRNQITRLFLRNKDLTLICNNCLGGCVLHDFGLRFNTPTINLFIRFPDYIVFLKNLDYYLSHPLEDMTGSSPYPIGMISDDIGGGILIHFLHYKTFSEAKKTWLKRCNRVNWKNLYIVLVERDGCSYDDLRQFDRLPHPNKIAFVHRRYSDIQSQFVIEDFSANNEVGNMMDYIGFLGKRIYDRFDWVKFLNS